MQNSLFTGKKVMITGGLGFIGSNLAHELVKLKARVLIVDSLSPLCGGNIFNIKGIKNKCKVVIRDISEQSFMNSLVKNQDFIFNLAGQVSHVDSTEDPFQDLETNCHAQLSLLEACKKHNPKAKIVFAGTRGQYGKTTYLPVDENHPMNPADVNGINKIAAESYHMIYHRHYGLRTTSLRLTNTYGPRQQMKNKNQGFVNFFIRSLMESKNIKIFGDGMQLRDLNYIDDVTKAFLISAVSQKTDGQVFNLGSNKGVSVIGIANLVIELFGAGRIEHISFPENYSKVEIGDYIADVAKIKQILNWEASVSLKEGLKATIAYYKKNRRHYWE
ncbi:NAD-dependent epimerase/dehydratase family protein [Candidatus Omnitrophota bacterium]